jgi:hypothetical protein
LADAAAHVFTTREPVLRAGVDGAEAGWLQVAAELAVSPGSVVRLRQVHGRAVLVAAGGEETDSRDGVWGVGDAAIAADPHLALSVGAADCVPALLADRRSGAVAAVHAGWRGTAAGVAGAAIDALVDAFGSDPANLIVAIGPSIGPCCYRVGGEVADTFATTDRWQSFLGGWLAPSPSRHARQGIPGTDPAAAGGRAMFLDTWTANADQFAAAGVPRSQIHVSGLCTSCHREVFHSYRVDGEKAGRMAAVIRAGKSADSST